MDNFIFIKSVIYHSIKLPFDANVAEKILNVIYYLHGNRKYFTPKYINYYNLILWETVQVMNLLHVVFEAPRVAWAIQPTATDDCNMNMKN